MCHIRVEMKTDRIFRSRQPWFKVSILRSTVKHLYWFKIRFKSTGQLYCFVALPICSIMNPHSPIATLWYHFSSFPVKCLHYRVGWGILPKGSCIALLWIGPDIDINTVCHLVGSNTIGKRLFILLCIQNFTYSLCAGCDGNRLIDSESLLCSY